MKEEEIVLVAVMVVDSAVVASSREVATSAVRAGGYLFNESVQFLSSSIPTISIKQFDLFLCEAVTISPVMLFGGTAYPRSG